MNNYPLTPPSSSEDSPQSMYYTSSPPSSSLSPPHSLIPSNTFGLPYEFSNNVPPYLHIVEQPIDRFRFRYKSEMTGTHGSLCGQTSDRSRKQTYPSVELRNWDKPAIIRCSIYQINTKENDKPHPHRLIKKQGKGEVDDPHDACIKPEDGYIYTFHNMGIIHTAKKNLIPELIKKKTQLKKEEIARREGKVRDLSLKEEVEIKGLADAESKSINLNVVCLRFDAFYSQNGILHRICPPVFSHSINNLKSALTGELKIVRMDHCTSPAKGGREVYILVERVTKKNIKIKFFELDDDDNIIWEEYAKFSDLDVHHQYAIVFKTPPYKDLHITNAVKVYIELERPSDRARSEPREFTYIPTANIYRPGSKRPRTCYNGSSSYDTSLSSDELPAPINNLNISNVDTAAGNLLETIEMELSSTELEAAVTNIDSAEFQRLFEHVLPEYQSITLDAPKNAIKKDLLQPFAGKSSESGKAVVGSNYVRENSVDQLSMAQEAICELREFVKTHPSDDKVVSMLNKHLKTDFQSNPLHILTRQKDNKSILFLLKMIFVWKQYDLLNIRNKDYETALHIATYCNLDDIVESLISCKANAAIVDGNHNTPLHIAVMCNSPISLFSKLLSAENVKEFIDSENEDGSTPLVLAIESKNLEAVKLLCRHGANVNWTHKKNGFSPLRFSIEKENLEITKFLLEHNDINPLLDDFQGLNPLHAVFKKNNPELLTVVTNYMKNNDYCDVEVKNELEEFAEDEVEEKFAIKLEQITQEELNEYYSNVKDFTPTYLDTVSQILDKSGTWQDLAELLGLGHLTRTVLCDSKSSPTKILLKFAIETNSATVSSIRDFLFNLDETQAVEVMDEMVKSQFVA